jgi:glutaredoxin
MVIAFPTTMVAIPQFPLLHSKQEKRLAKLISLEDQLFKIEKEAQLHAKRKAGLFRHPDGQILSPKIKISNIGKIGSSNIFLGKKSIREES